MQSQTDKPLGKWSLVVGRWQGFSLEMGHRHKTNAVPILRQALGFKGEQFQGCLVQKRILMPKSVLVGFLGAGSSFILQPEGGWMIFSAFSCC